ncbi:MAG TPA: SDR family oxidoreductase [Candidatus Tectomicrobia bacterium]|nr:SDR family oxidoreductase [Candidatus Tectomicrobia bacterium]
MLRILITGANRGLGLEFVRQYLEQGAHVFAACRRPTTASSLHRLQAQFSEQLTIVALDVADAAVIRAAHDTVHTQVDSLDVLINNAAIYSSRGSHEPSERLGELSFEDALTVLRVNAVAPLLVAQQFLGLLRASRRAKLISISSGYGSVSANTGGFPYYYSASKAALNMYMRSLATDAKRWGITTVLLDPGWVRTDMGGPSAPTTPQEAVAAMMRVIDALTPRHNGRFLTWRGDEQDW